MWDSKYFSFASDNYDISSNHLSTFHYILLTVSLIGFSLAVFNEDSATGSHRLSWITYEFLPMPETHNLKNYSIKQKFKNPRSPFLRIIYDFLAVIACAVYEGSLVNLIQVSFKKLKLYYEFWALKRHAESKRHIFYLLEKKILNLPIHKGETEMSSYLDAKRHMIKNENWPFFWSVKNVRDKHIECEGCLTITMSSYSYLDFLRNDEVQSAAIAAAKEYATGNHGPRMLGGGSDILRTLEKITGRFFGREDSLIFATGYLACMSAPSAVSRPGDLIVYDSRSHASLRSGIKLSDIVSIPFPHNNFKHCEETLIKHRHKYRNCWIIMESVYSMDGDLGDLPAAYNLCKKYNCQIILDEAHGLGVIGKTGRGLEEFYNLPGVCTLIVGTYSKSIGGIGGYIVGNNDMVQFLDFHSQGNLFSAPLTAYSAGGAIKAFELIDREPSILQKLHYNIKFFRKSLKDLENYWPKDYPDKFKFIVEGSEYTSVIPIIYPRDPDRVFRIAISLRKKGYMVSAVAYPACPINSPRLRITVTTNYEESDVLNFIKNLIKTSIECVPNELSSDVTF